MNRRHFLAATTVGLAAPALVRAQGGQQGGQQGTLKSAKATFRLVTLPNLGSALVAGNYSAQVDDDTLPAGYSAEALAAVPSLMVGASSPGRAPSICSPASVIFYRTWGLVRPSGARDAAPMRCLRRR